jgi:hypothetical protein
VLRAGRVQVGKRPLGRVKRQLHDLGLDLYVEGIHAIRNGTAEFVTQSGGSTPLYRDPGAGDILRFWLRYLARLMNLRSVGS